MTHYSAPRVLNRIIHKYRNAKIPDEGLHQYVFESYLPEFMNNPGNQ